MPPVSYRYDQEHASANPERRWWTLSEKDAAGSLTAVLNSLGQHQSRRLSQALVSARLYGNLSPFGIFAFSRPNVGAQNVFRDRITYNVIQSAVDTVTSKIAKNKPKPFFQTKSGDYRMQRRAQKLTQFNEGCFYENNAHKLGLEIFRDSCVFGTGCIKVLEHHGRVRFERVLATELFVDDIEAFYGEPRQLHHLKNLDRDTAKELWGNSQAIKDAPPAKIYETDAYPMVSDQVTVRESWHLPSGPDAKDGKHIISVESGVLLSEPWTRNHFPFAFLHWCKRLNGFWGQGLAEQIQNIQIEVNKLLWLIQRSYHLAGSYKILIENTSRIVKEHLNNDIGTVVTYTGTPPQYVTPPIIPPEIYQHLLSLKNAAFEQAGISVLSAQGKKPEGLNSGKALRTMNDIESDRFADTGQRYEQLFLDLGKLAIETIKDITKGGKHSYTVNIPGRRFIETVDFRDVDLEEDQYVMQAFPISSLPNEPAGRLQTIQEYISAGFLDQAEGRRLLNFPDLDRIEDLASAEEDYLFSIFEKMVEKGEFTSPEPFDDLQLAQKMALQQYATGKLNGLEEAKLDLLRKFITQCQGLLNPPAPPPDVSQAPPDLSAALPPAGPPGAGAPLTAVPPLPPQGTQAA